MALWTWLFLSDFFFFLTEGFVFLAFALILSRVVHGPPAEGLSSISPISGASLGSRSRGK